MKKYKHLFTSDFVVNAGDTLIITTGVLGTITVKRQLNDSIIRVPKNDGIIRVPKIESVPIRITTRSSASCSMLVGAGLGFLAIMLVEFASLFF